VGEGDGVALAGRLTVGEGDGVAVAGCLAVGDGVALGVELSSSAVTGVLVCATVEVWRGALTTAVSVVEVRDEGAHPTSQTRMSRTRLKAQRWTGRRKVLLTDPSLRFIFLALSGCDRSFRSCGPTAGPLRTGY
jgi:hypothetical protein